MRRLLALTAILILAACKPQGADEAFTDSRIPPNLEQRFWPPVGWAWGLIQPGEAPPVRYGVAGPLGVRPRGDLLILTGYGESAEVWFETVAALRQQGYTVWVLEGAGQGGSARFTAPRDLGHLQDNTVDADALRAMLAIIGKPPLVVAQSTAASVAVAAAADHAPLRALVLSAPVFDAGAAPMRASAGPAAAMARFRLGWMRATGQKPWARQERPPPGRGGVIAAWQMANPDLRMGGVSWGWIASFEKQTAALTRERLKRVAVPVTVLAAPDAARAQSLCRSMPACRLRTLPGASGSLHLEPDPVYRPWFAALSAEAARLFPPIAGA